MLFNKFKIIPLLLLLTACGDQTVTNFSAEVPALFLSFGVSDIVQDSTHTHLLGTFTGTRNFDPAGTTQGSLTASQNSIFLASYTLANQFSSVKMISGSGTVTATSLRLDAEGNKIILGSFTGTANFDMLGGTYNLTALDTTDAFLAKYTSDGTLVWAYRFGASGASLNAKSLDLDDSGNAYFNGWFKGTVDFNPTSGTDSKTTLGLNDLFLTRINSDGTYSYTLRLGSTISDGGFLGKMKIKDGYLYYSDGYKSTVNFNPNGTSTTKTTNNTTDVFVAKYTLEAQLVWVKTFPCTGGYQYTADIGIDSSGNVYTLGYSGGGTITTDPNGGSANLVTPSGGAAYYFVVKLDSSGNYGWSYMLSNSGVAYSPRYFDDEGNLYYGGSFTSSKNFDLFGGDDTISPEGTQDAFLTLLNNDGTYGGTYTFNGGSSHSAAISYIFPLASTLFVQGTFDGSMDLRDLGDTNSTREASTSTTFLIGVSTPNF